MGSWSSADVAPQQAEKMFQDVLTLVVEATKVGEEA